MHNTDGYVPIHNMLHRTIRPYPLAKLIIVSVEHRAYCRPLCSYTPHSIPTLT